MDEFEKPMCSEIIWDYKKWPKLLYNKPDHNFDFKKKHFPPVAIQYTILTKS